MLLSSRLFRLFLLIFDLLLLCMSHGFLIIATNKYILHSVSRILSNQMLFAYLIRHNLRRLQAESTQVATWLFEVDSARTKCLHHVTMAAHNDLFAAGNWTATLLCLLDNRFELASKFECAFIQIKIVLNMLTQSTHFLPGEYVVTILVLSKHVHYLFLFVVIHL